MAFQNNSYATVWEIRRPEKGNYVNVRLSTSRKRKDSGEYVNDFSGWTRFIGNAYEKAATLNERDRIQLLNISATYSYNSTNNTSYHGYQVYDFVIAPSFKSSQNDEKPKLDVNVPDDLEDEELPF